jgi:histidine decarboxylase
MASEKFYIHCDGALAGMLLPFHEETTTRGHDYHISFKSVAARDDTCLMRCRDGLDSISVSGHKMLGCPMPCGVVVTKKVGAPITARLNVKSL